MRGLRAPAADLSDRPAAGTPRPVLLATLGVPLTAEAGTVAVDAAFEAGQALVIVNAVELPPLAMSVKLGYALLEDRAELAASLSRPTERARSLGIEVERVRVRSMRPLVALLEVVAERSPGLLVFGPDPGLLGPRAYRRASRAVCDRTPCLVWLPD